MMKKLILILLVIGVKMTFAVNLIDVEVLEIQSSNELIKLKLHSKTLPQESFFYVSIPSTDKDSFSKLSILLNKLRYNELFSLNLEIKSFSANPSGSHYLSPYVQFSGSIKESKKRKPNDTL